MRKGRRKEKRRRREETLNSKGDRGKAEFERRKRRKCKEVYRKGRRACKNEVKNREGERT